MSNEILPSDVVAAARGWIGTPYRHGAAVKGVGADCLGLLRGVWAELYGVPAPVPPPYSPAWGEGFSGAGELLLKACRATLQATCGHTFGTVVVLRPQSYGPAKHCGILVSECEMVHAVMRHGVVISNFNAWRGGVVEAFVFPEVYYG